MKKILMNTQFNNICAWFSLEKAEEERCKSKRHWDTFHYLQTKAFNT